MMSAPVSERAAHKHADARRAQNGCVGMQPRCIRARAGAAGSHSYWQLLQAATGKLLDGLYWAAATAAAAGCGGFFRHLLMRPRICCSWRNHSRPPGLRPCHTTAATAHARAGPFFFARSTKAATSTWISMTEGMSKRPGLRRTISACICAGEYFSPCLTSPRLNSFATSGLCGSM